MSFNGSHFHGWQSQLNASSVQSEIERAMHTLLLENVKVIGAGRTDTGVHAKFYVAHFDTDHQLPIPEKDFVYKMNALLPQEIAVESIYQVQPEAHARYSAISRTYMYYISMVKDPFYNGLSWHLSSPLNVEAMNNACKILLEVDDFTSFSKLHSDVNNNICQLYEASWSVTDNQLIFTIRANRFLRNMVRSIVGTMVDIGRGKTNMDMFRRIIAGKDRKLAGFSAPAQGLFLVQIVYPDSIKL